MCEAKLDPETGQRKDKHILRHAFPDDTFKVQQISLDNNQTNATRHLHSEGFLPDGGGGGGMILYELGESAP